jgi:hypothetical protein
MSYLREIMQRLTAAQAAPAEAPGHPLMGLHSRQYAEQLVACTEAMLHYELAWLEQHRQALELCRVNPGMLQVAGGERHLARMLEDTEQFEALLAAELERRGLAPDPHRHTVVANEHAWELSHAAICQAWGIEPPDRS